MQNLKVWLLSSPDVNLLNIYEAFGRKNTLLGKFLPSCFHLVITCSSDVLGPFKVAHPLDHTRLLHSLKISSTTTCDAVALISVVTGDFVLIFSVL